MGEDSLCQLSTIGGLLWHPPIFVALSHERQACSIASSRLYQPSRPELKIACVFNAFLDGIGEYSQGTVVSVK